MENVTLGAILTVALAISAAVNQILGAAEKLQKTKKSIKAPEEEQNDRLQTVEKWRDGVDRKLIQDYERLNSIEESNRVTQRALLALLGHGLDGNNIEQMETAKKQLENHLINR